MAKLGSYYGLCPLIENKSLLGISEDLEKGIALVTLGKNIASRYRLSDQKQVCCWKTKEKFSSAVIYDKKSSKYLAVFNQTYIKLWDVEEEQLDKLKKYKFNKQIYTVFTNRDNTFVLFQNGSMYTLEKALELGKSLPSQELIPETELIDDILVMDLNNRLYIGIITKCAHESYLYWTNYNSTKYTFTKRKLERDDFIMRGCTLHNIENNTHFLTLWSDGKMFSLPLEDFDSEETSAVGELFAVAECLSTKYRVCMLSLDENYIAMFGANSNEEGAILLIYNTQFKITQTRQPFKLFAESAKLWNYENNLFLPVGQNLAVIPFSLETEQLAALVGSHKAIQDELNDDISIIQEMEIVSWENKFKIKDPHFPETLIDKFYDILKQGLPESIIMETILSVILKDNDLNFLTTCINYFLDIPEKYLANLLKYLIVLDKEIFPNQTEHKAKLFPPELQPLSRTELIDKILCKSFSETLLLPYLRSEFTISEVVTLLDYIRFLLSEEGHLLPSLNVTKTSAKLIEWSCIVIDANYQKLLLSKDSHIRNVLDQLNVVIENHLSSFNDLKFLSSILSYFKSKKSCNSDIGPTNTKYFIEQLCLY